MLYGGDNTGYKKLSHEEERKLVEEYISGASVESLMKKYGYKNKKSITDKVRKYYPDDAERIISLARNNRKSYKINFNGITNRFNAQFLGLMSTDGYIQDDNKFGIDLTDEDCIRFISEVTNKEYKTYNTNDIGNKLRYRIIFSNIEVVNKLAEYGVVKNKSKVLGRIPIKDSEHKYLPYLIRGIIDGDGCIYKTSYGAPAVYICSGSKEFLEWLKYILENDFFFQELNLSVNKDGVWRLETANQLNIIKLIANIYDTPYGMSRKYNLLRKTLRDYNGDNLLLS